MTAVIALAYTLILPCEYKIQFKIMVLGKNKYNCGDKVFAKIKGYPYWPAIVNNTTASGKLKKYSVTFYGTNEVGCVKEIDICSYLENKSRFAVLKKKNLKFNNAIKEAELSLNSTLSQK